MRPNPAQEGRVCNDEGLCWQSFHLEMVMHLPAMSFSMKGARVTFIWSNCNKSANACFCMLPAGSNGFMMRGLPDLGDVPSHGGLLDVECALMLNTLEISDKISSTQHPGFDSQKIVINRTLGPTSQ